MNYIVLKLSGSELVSWIHDPQPYFDYMETNYTSKGVSIEFSHESLVNGKTCLYWRVVK